MEIKGKVAIVTGASSGFGKALSERLVKLGAFVVLGDITEPAGRALEAQLNSSRPKSAVFVKCNVTDRRDLQNLFTVAKKQFGEINIMVNNAGIGEKMPFFEDKEDGWRIVVDIDLTAVIMGTRMAVNEMVKQGKGGAIVNTASLAGMYPQPLQPVYSAVKGGVVMFTRSLDHLADDHGIYVNAVCPSFSPTGILDSEAGRAISATTPLVPVELVIDAFIKAIQDETLKGAGIDSRCGIAHVLTEPMCGPPGATIRVTPKYGIDVPTHRGGKPVPKAKM
ncbi:hypothetical protein HK105_204684 [Polyrhizophydium stewartii]|uniref:15-hydroxyprostaglandin dehydrogenase n=1 Tax=Polyrhizophydium stewartii TaxID=2732419 RepID=A0ABR4N881_9FUNG